MHFYRLYVSSSHFQLYITIYLNYLKMIITVFSETVSLLSEMNGLFFEIPHKPKRHSDSFLGPASR